MRVIPKEDSTPIESYSILYIEVIDLLGAPRRNKKDEQGIQVKVLGYLLYTEELTISLPLEKVLKAIVLTSSVLAKTLLLLADSRTLAGFLTWCALAVQLG